MPQIEHSHPKPEERSAAKTYVERKPNRFKVEPGFVTCLGCGVSNATPMTAANATRFFKKHGGCLGGS